MVGSLRRWATFERGTGPANAPLPHARHSRGEFPTTKPKKGGRRFECATPNRCQRRRRANITSVAAHNRFHKWSNNDSEGDLNSFLKGLHTRLVAYTNPATGGIHGPAIDKKAKTTRIKTSNIHS